MAEAAVDKEKEKQPKRARGAEDEVRMTFGEHLEDLRSRLFKSIVFLMCAIIVAMIFYKELVGFITQPHLQAMAMLNVKDAPLMPGSYGGPIIAVMKLAFIISMFVSSPWVGYQLWSFVSAGLYKNERKYVVLFAPISFALFTVGCVFGYVILVPYALYGLARTMNVEIISNQYIFSDYLNLVMLLTIILGAVFQMPLLMVFFSKIGLVEPRTYHKWRRAAIIGNVVFAAVVTPADVITMLVVAGPMLLLYEVGVICAYVFSRPRQNSPAA